MHLPLAENLTQALDYKIRPGTTAKKAFVGIVILACVAYGSWAFNKAMYKTKQLDASAEVRTVFRAIDRATNIGRVYVDRHGKILRWTDGMQEITGYTNQEMLHSDMLRLDPHGSEEDSAIAAAVFSRHTHPWAATGFMDLRHKDGSPVYVLVTIFDAGATEYRELTFALAERVEDLGDIEETVKNGEAKL